MIYWSASGLFWLESSLYGSFITIEEEEVINALP